MFTPLILLAFKGTKADWIKATLVAILLDLCVFLPMFVSAQQHTEIFESDIKCCTIVVDYNSQVVLYQAYDGFIDEDYFTTEEDKESIINTMMDHCLDDHSDLVTILSDKETITTDYCIELVNQNTVKLHSHSTDRMYTCSPKDITRILEFDTN